MVTEWISAGKLPKEMIDEVKEFYSSDNGKKLGFVNQSQILIAALREFMMKYKYVINRTTPIPDQTIEFVSIVNNQLVLKDSKAGVVVIDINDKNKMCCKHCGVKDGEDCEHVKWCLLNEEVWPILKKFNVKIRRVRS